MRNIVVVGASLAGLHAAVAIRRADFEGTITVVGDEPHYPYDRPPLSKDFLAGSTEAEALRLRAAADPAETGVEWDLGRRAVALRLADGDDGDDRGRVGGGAGPTGGTITLDDGRVLEADGIVIATGAAPRQLPGADGLGGVHLLRTLDDAVELRAAFDATPNRVVVIGCGFIGAEVAATARGRGLEVTIVEAAPFPLARVLDAEAGMAVADLHRGHGVDVRLGVGVQTLDRQGDRVQAVTLDDGSVVPTDLVVVGIGVAPNTDWLDGAGLLIDDGIVADATCVAAPGVVVAGDVARWPNGAYGDTLMRVEQWDNAVEMGRYAGNRLLALLDDNGEGADHEPFAPVPWFWSDQYDRKMQLAGIAGDRHEMVQGTLAEQRFVRLYLDGDGRATGALCWNRPRQAIMARQLLAARAPADEFRDKLS